MSICGIYNIWYLVDIYYKWGRTIATSQKNKFRSLSGSWSSIMSSSMTYMSRTSTWGWSTPLNPWGSTSQRSKSTTSYNLSRSWPRNTYLSLFNPNFLLPFSNCSIILTKTSTSHASSFSTNLSLRSPKKIKSLRYTTECVFGLLTMAYTIA